MSGYEQRSSIVLRGCLKTDSDSTHCEVQYLSPLTMQIISLERAKNGLTENDGHEIGGQDIYRLKIDYITMQCAILFKTTAEYKSQLRSKFYRPHVIVE